MTIEELYKIIEDRKKNMPDKSYVTSLFRDGADRILQKVGEESTEVIIAAKNEGKNRIMSEVTDLLFHTIVLLVSKDIQISDIISELEKRKLQKKSK